MARSTQTLIGKDAKKAIIKGIRAVAIPVASTFGPEGKNALLFRTFNRGSRITNDGYTVSECQIPRNPFIRSVAETFREACKRTNDLVGDGTTNTTIIGWILAEQVYKAMTNTESAYSSAARGSKKGVNTIKREILASAEKVKEAIKKMAVKIDMEDKEAALKQVERIAIISVEDETIGKTVAKMAVEVGIDGFIDVTEGFKGEIETEVIKGMRFAAKVAAPGFVNNSAKYEMIANDAAVFVTNYALDNVRQVVNVFDPIISKHPKIIIIAPSFSTENLTEFWNLSYALQNGQKVKNPSGVDVYPVAVPGLRTEQLEDIAIYCGATFIDKNKNKKLEGVTEKDLGFLEKLVVKSNEAKEDAVATGGAGTREQILQVPVLKKREVKRGKDLVEKEEKVMEEKMGTRVAERIEELKKQIDETREEPFKMLLKRRIAGLSSAVGIIKVGASTKANALYQKLKIEDAVNACKSALRAGYVPGAGECLRKIAETLDDDDMLKPAILAPSQRLQASVDGGIEITDDIIDPAEAIYYGVDHAAMVVANLATVDTITVEMEDPIHGEGEFAIARALKEGVIEQKRHNGHLQENEEELWRDGMVQNFGTENLEEIELMDKG